MKLLRSWGLVFGALLLQLIFNPCLESVYESGWGWLYIVLNCLVVLAIIYLLSTSKVSFTVAVTLGTPVLVLYWIPRSYLTEVLSLCFAISIYLLATFRLIHCLFQTAKAGFEELYAAGSLYLILGLTWALLYQLLELIIPGSFQISSLPLGSSEFNLGEFTYYSFTTLTTLGYGDVVPIGCHARSLAILEAVSGLLCLSFVIARLIGIHVALHQKFKN